MRDADALATGAPYNQGTTQRVSLVHPERLWGPSLGSRNFPNALTAKPCLVQIMGTRVTDLVVGHFTGLPSLTLGLYIICIISVCVSQRT